MTSFVIIICLDKMMKMKDVNMKTTNVFFSTSNYLTFGIFRKLKKVTKKWK